MAVKALILAAALLACASTASAEDATADILERMRSQRPRVCSISQAFRETGVVRTAYGRFDRKSLIAAAKTVLGEASPDPDEQCAVALTIFNRAREDGSSLLRVVSAPGQFEGYSTSDRGECVKLQGSVAAVKLLADGGRCSFGDRGFRFFCSADHWNRVKKRRKKGAEAAEIIGESAFLVNGPC